MVVVMATSNADDVTEPLPTGVVTRYARAWERGDVATITACYADDVVTHYGGRSPFAGTHVGRDRLLEILVVTRQRGRRELVSIDQIHDDGPTGALFVTERLIVDGAPVTVRRALRYRTNGHQLVECWLYDHDQHVVDAAWRDPATA